MILSIDKFTAYPVCSECLGMFPFCFEVKGEKEKSDRVAGSLQYFAVDEMEKRGWKVNISKHNAGICPECCYKNHAALLAEFHADDRRDD